MHIVHVVEGSVVVKGGKESHLNRFIVESTASGHRNSLVADSISKVKGAEDLIDITSNQRLSYAPDVILLHSTRSWRLAKVMSKVAPTFAWVHDYAFVCPASISWFRNTGQVCNLPLGLHCVTNAYSKWCNARRPDRNLKNYFVSRRSLSGVPYLRGVIVASSYMKERLTVNLVPEELVHVLPYFVPDVGHEGAPQGGEKANRILFVGRLSEVKGVELLLDALALLPPEYELVVAGDGYNRKNVEEHLKRTGVAEERVIFDGYVDSQERLQSLYQSAAVVAIPSLWPEPFGIVGLEALKQGKPVVAFDVGGIREWLSDGNVGLLADPGDARDLAAKLLQLLRDPARRRRLGLSGRKHVRENFSWDAHWTRFNRIVANQ